MKPERITLTCLFILAVLGIILVILGVSALPVNPYAGAIYVMIGAAQLLIQGISLAFARGKSERDLGNVMVIGCWWVMSVGIAGLALFTSSLFGISLAYNTISCAFCVIWVALGAFNIWLMVLKLKAGIVV